MGLKRKRVDESIFFSGWTVVHFSQAEEFESRFFVDCPGPEITRPNLKKDAFGPSLSRYRHPFRKKLPAEAPSLPVRCDSKIQQVGFVWPE